MYYYRLGSPKITANELYDLEASNFEISKMVINEQECAYKKKFYFDHQAIHFSLYIFYSRAQLLIDIVFDKPKSNVPLLKPQ